jgi:hypothetical protein
MSFDIYIPGTTENSKIICLSFLVTNASSLSLEFVSSSFHSSVTNASSLSLEFVSSSFHSSVTNASSLSLEFVSSSFHSSVTNASSLSLEFVSSSFYSSVTNASSLVSFQELPQLILFTAIFAHDPKTDAVPSEKTSLKRTLKHKCGRDISRGEVYLHFRKGFF